MAETNTEQVVRIIASPYVELETAAQQVLNGLDIDHAIGAQLDLIGKKVGRARNGESDDIYRRYLRATVRANKSNGTIDEILAIASLIINDPAATLVFDNSGAAAFTLRVEDATIADEVATVLVQLIGKATAGGVRSILNYTTGAPASSMYWGTGAWGQNWTRSRNTEQ